MGRLQRDIQRRVLDFAVAILALTDELPSNNKGWEIGRQMIRAATSIGANLSEADRALSDADFAYKVSVARKEAAETEYWLKLIVQARMVAAERAADLAKEIDELVRILSAIVKRTQMHLERSRD